MILDNLHNGIADSVPHILAHLAEQRGVDFSAYRAGTVRRRIAVRCRALGLPEADYLRFLKEHPAETDALLDALTIKVSRFFRDPLVFEVLQAFVLPGLIERCKNDTLRIWCAGCARGEEAYSVAILLKELCGEAPCPPLLILATDIDREALEDAGRAVYLEESLGEVKKRRLDAWFNRTEDRYSLNGEIRSLVTFACHDVTSGRPPKEGVFSDYHLILCRNVLIYFDRELQGRVMRRLSGMLGERGHLVLGEAETMTGPEFEEVLPKTRVYRKRSGTL